MVPIIEMKNPLMERHHHRRRMEEGGGVEVVRRVEVAVKAEGGVVGEDGRPMQGENEEGKIAIITKMRENTITIIQRNSNKEGVT